MQIIDAWFRDIPQQFLGKQRIEVLIRAFARQLQELQQVFDDMNEKLDLGAAAGRNLDYVGTIIPLTRKEAGELAGLGMSDAILSDEKYASILKYKLLRNTSSCTYYDIMEGLKYLYDFQFGYKEDARYPATILLDMPLELDQPDLIFRQRLCIKPGGVGILGRKLFQPVSVHIEIGYAAGLVIRGDFWPRRNVPRHYLNGMTRLDGRYPLSGYLSGQSLDFYPAALRISCEAGECAKTAADGRTVFCCGAAETAESEAALYIRGEENAGATPVGGMQVSAGAGEAGRTTVTGYLRIEKNWGTLDGSCRLDGSRELDAVAYEVEV